MPPRLPLSSLRLTIFTAAGLGFAACSSEPSSPSASAGATSTTTGATTTAASTGATTTADSTGGGAGGAGGQGGTGGAPFVDPVCEGAEPVVTAMGAPTGFARCPDGTYHRISPVTCDPFIPAPACSGGEKIISCTADADCTDGPNGRCATTIRLTDDGPTSICACRYSCSDDLECGPSKICVCGGFLGLDEDWSTCAPASCGSSGDCASGECGLSIYDNGCTVELALACRAKDDVCRLNESCVPDAGGFQQCVLPKDSPYTWTCTGLSCQLGRPLQVEGQARVAPRRSRADFHASVEPSLDGLDASTRRALAEHWLAAGALEHASVASFARFSLDLLALGAPADLLAATQQAALDEIEHARLCYGLGSAYAGRAIGPGPLSLAGLSLAPDRRAFLRALIEEGCVGESLAAAEALGMADAARDPAVRAGLSRIAADEAEHAALAWKTLAWALGAADEAERAFIAQHVEAALRRAGDDPAPPAIVAPEHGLASATTLGAWRRQALAEVVKPCAAGLLVPVG